MVNVNILYICDRKACKNCHEECKHTINIEHAVNRYDINGRMFEYVDNGNQIGFFEVE